MRATIDRVMNEYISDKADSILLETNKVDSNTVGYKILVFSGDSIEVYSRSELEIAASFVVKTETPVWLRINGSVCTLDMLGAVVGVYGDVGLCRADKIYYVPEYKNYGYLRRQIVKYEKRAWADYSYANRVDIVIDGNVKLCKQIGWHRGPTDISVRDSVECIEQCNEAYIKGSIGKLGKVKA